jgi:3-dehydroquinate synthase
VKTVEVNVGTGGYPVHVGHGVLADIGDCCAGLGLGHRVAVISDAQVQSCRDAVLGSLERSGFAPAPISFGGGDGAKNLDTVEAVIGQMIEAELDRGAWVAAVGGGVVGDLAGFVAATFLRGVPFVQIPTTIVAQVDASIGGKTGVNHRLGKNTIGAFHQPRMVYIDTDVLRSLPRRELVAGMAEVVKHAVIRDAELFAFLEESLESLLAMEIDPCALDQLVVQNVRIKVDVVQEDEREDGLRAILNYGHTIGHAIEASTNYETYCHGEAVILGMIGAGEIAVRQDLWPESERRRQDELLRRLGVPSGLSRVSADLIVERTKADKKRVDGRPRFILGQRIGCVAIVDGIDDQTIRDGVEYIQSNYES